MPHWAIAIGGQHESVAQGPMTAFPRQRGSLQWERVSPVFAQNRRRDVGRPFSARNKALEDGKTL